MNYSFQTQLFQIIQDDEWMMEQLAIVRDLNLPDAWIGAGFVRNKVWDYLHEQKTSLGDIDVIFFDPLNLSREQDLNIEQELKSRFSSINWSVKNQARMHSRNGHLPYKNCEHAISFWPETATAIAVRITANDKLECIAPYGLDDLFGLRIVKSPNADLEVYAERLKKKAWIKVWDKLTIL